MKPAANGQPTQRPFRLKYEKLQGELNALIDPAQRGLAVHGVRDAKTIADTELRVRGEAEKLGPAIPRGYLTSINVPDAKPINTKQSGRKELAEWLTSPKNPLFARVAVNRVWSHLFGQGLVSTVDNFGSTCDTPSHPELLDSLANQFIRDGYRIKALIRTLVLTRAYQLSAESTATHGTIDPRNALLWRHNPRRLTAEEFRDGVLASSGRLDTKKPTGTFIKDFKMVELRDNGPEAKSIHEAAEKSLSRSVYLPLLRGITPPSLAAFDPVEQTLVTGTRDETTVPTQALFLLNSAFIRKQSLALAERVAKDKPTDSERVTVAYRTVLGRTPSVTEANRALAFIAEYESAAREGWVNVAEKPKPKPKAEAAKPIDPNQDPDTLDQTGEAVSEEVVRANDPRTAAWLAFVQSLYASAEFRFVK